MRRPEEGLNGEDQGQAAAEEAGAPEAARYACHVLLVLISVSLERHRNVSAMLRIVVSFAEWH